MPKKPTTNTPEQDEALSRITVFLVNGKTPAGVRSWALRPAPEGAGLQARVVTRLMAEAKRRICAAASYNRDEELGMAKSRLNDIYARESGKSGNIRIALAAQRELNELLGLHGSDSTVAGEAGQSEADAELEAVRSYLEPLKLAGENTSASELARLAVQRIVEMESERKI